jgi:tRNA nucleotidyltransferase (CCA-adding enzyme)
MQIYKVGGAVRDQLLGQPVTEKDWVVVGGTAEELLAQGFRPVGADFPVFLHPKTGEEYALARTERKSGRGYGGFTFFASLDVTLEDDLIRRDLTINAMAEDEKGHIIDPYGGLEDLKARQLRHVSPAFVEDPLRVLRVARFAARYRPLGFEVAPETLSLMQQMAASGELDALTPERMWKEISRALMESRPDVFIQTLHDCGALNVLLPEVDATFNSSTGSQGCPHVLNVLRQCASQAKALPIRWACLLVNANLNRENPDQSMDSVKEINSRFKVSRDCSELALLVNTYRGHIERAYDLDSRTLLETFQAFDLFRRPTRFDEFLQACIMNSHADHCLPHIAYLRAASQAAVAVTVQPLLEKGLKGAELGEALKQSRLAAIEAHRCAYFSGNA